MLHPGKKGVFYNQDMPRRGSRLLQFIKEKDRQKTIKIKNLQDKQRHLKRRIKNLDGLLSDLKNKGMLSHDAADHILVKIV